MAKIHVLDFKKPIKKPRKPPVRVALIVLSEEQHQRLVQIGQETGLKDPNQIAQAILNSALAPARPPNPPKSRR